MADQQHVPPPPPRGQGAAPPVPQRQAMVIPRNNFGQLVRQGFGLGIGIWLAFAAVGAVVWVPLILLAVLGAAGS